MCLDLIRLRSLLASTRVKALNRGRYEPSVVKKMMRVLARQDLSLRNGLSEGRLDLLGFVKATGFPGLLGCQVFKGIDRNEDGVVDICDFLEALEALTGEIPDLTAEFLFTVLDSGLRGFLTPEDVFSLFQNLQSPDLEQNINDAFQGNSCMEFDRFLKLVHENFHLIEFIKSTILSGFPSILLNFPCSNPTEIEKFQSTRVYPLLLNSRKYYAEIKSNALLCYNSVACSHLVTVVLLRDVYLEDKPGNRFNIGNLEFGYEVEMESEEGKRYLMGKIREIVNPEKFEFDSKESEQIGSGAYGKIFKSTYPPLPHPVAIKLISKVGLTRKVELSIRREIDALRSISHPNIISLYAVHETKTEIILIIEYLPHGTLLDWLQNRDFKPTEADIKSISKDIASALMAIHKQGIIHRDVKLENIMMVNTSTEAHVKLIDFGLCCVLGPNQMAEESVGTLKYVAPEVLARIRYREKVDCWSLGVVVFVMMRGMMPFGGKNDEETAMSVLKRRISFNGEKWAGKSPLAIVAVSGLLLRNPLSRSSISDFLHSDWLQS